MPKSAPDAAQVIVFRSGTIVGGAISCAVHENGAKLTSLPPGHYAVLSVSPGPRDLVVASEANDIYKVDAQAGATYYAKCTVGAGFMAGHPHLTSSTEAEFAHMSEKLKPMIVVSRQANDPDSIRAIINASGQALWPQREADRPHPQFIRWHREHCFKR